MSIATHLLYRAATALEVIPGPHACVFCATPCQGIPAARVIRETFTNHGICRAPGSEWVCAACAHYFEHRWDCGQKYLAEYRKRSLVVTPSQVRFWDRTDMRADLQAWLREGTSEPVVLVISLSKKKHLVPLAAVNPPGRVLTVQLEEERVRLAWPIWQELSAAFDALLAAGFRKGEILSGAYSAHSLRRADLSFWRGLESVVAPHRDGSLLTLLSYVTVLEGEDADPGESERA